MLKNFYLAIMMMGLTACEPDAPTLSLTSGTYNEDQVLVISIEEGAEAVDIHYTLNGETPSSESELYVEPINLVGPESSYAVRAVAIFKDEYKEYISDVASADIEILWPSETPIIGLESGIYEGDQVLSLSHGDINASIYYTLDGSTPSESSILYDGVPIALSKDLGQVTIQAIAVQGSRPPSPAASSEIVLFDGGLSPSSISFQLDHLAEVEEKQVLIGNFSDELMNYEIDRVRLVSKEAITDPRIQKNPLSPKIRKKQTVVPDFAKDNVVPGELIVRMEMPQQSLGTASKLKAIPAAENLLAGQVSYKITGSKLLSKLSYGKNITTDENLDIIMQLTIDNKNPAYLVTAIEELQKLPEVLYAEPNYKVQINEEIPNDEYFDELYALKNTGQDSGTPGADISATKAWSLHQGNPNIRIGVIDTGVDYTHPDLVNNIWTNPGEIAGNGLDDDGNGYIDDVHGYDFYYDDSDPMDLNGHGTHVSGTIAATGNNGIGVAGVMWQAKIVAIQFLSSTGGGTSAGAISAIEYANTLGLAITSNSWGGNSFSQAIKDVIEAGDSLFVAAAGNNARDTDAIGHYPSAYDSPNILSVAASDNQDSLAYFSNYGASTVDLAAPGVSIFSTYLNDGYTSLNGTSMATPHVSGVAGLLLSLETSLSTTDIKEIILDSTDPISDFEGLFVTGGRLNAQKALSALSVDWLVVSTENDSLEPSEYGTISIALAPPEERAELQAGTYYLQVDVQTSDESDPLKTIDVTVIVNPCRNISFANELVDFGDVITGKSSTVILTATNTCNAPVLAQGFTLESEYGVFSLVGNWQFVVPPFTSKSRSIVFDSSGFYELGTFSIPMSIQTTADDIETIDFTYEGRTGNGAVLEMESTLAITVASGESGSAPLEISNSGDLDLSYKFQSSSSSYVKSLITNVPESDFPWQEISDIGTRLSISDNLDGVTLTDFGFEFTYDQSTYSEAYVSSNGLVGLGASSTSWINQPLPYQYIPSDSILPFWDDMYPGRRGDIYALSGQTEFILQYQDVSRFAESSASLTFQMQLKADGTIKFLYDVMEGDISSATIGYQMASGAYDQAAYNEEIIIGKTTLTYSPFAAMVEPSEAVLGIGQSQTGLITVDATYVDPGEYEIYLNIETNSIAGPSELLLLVTVI